MRRAYGHAPTDDADLADAIAALRLQISPDDALSLSAHAEKIDLPRFRDALGALRVRGCSRLIQGRAERHAARAAARAFREASGGDDDVYEDDFEAIDDHTVGSGPVCLDTPPPARTAAAVCHGVPESAPSPRDLSELPAPTAARRGLWRPEDSTVS